MKVVILAGGLGTRLTEETQVRPKPMIEIGGKPILWHIMKIYAAHGFSEFIVCCGYKGYVIKEYFSNIRLHSADVTFDMETGSTTIHQNVVDPWKVTLVETGESTQTGGRLGRIRQYLEGEEAFAMTYGDAVADVDLSALVEFHRREGTEATVTAVRPPARFGALEIEGSRVVRFEEKPLGGDAWINGGFFVLSPSVLDRITSDQTVWEHDPLENLAAAGQLSAYEHTGFWHPMDTMRDRNTLDELWNSGAAPWRTWS
jgi:glucose-1-phosphate cytidylyltransferase